MKMNLVLPNAQLIIAADHNVDLFFSFILPLGASVVP